MKESDDKRSSFINPDQTSPTLHSSLYPKIFFGYIKAPSRKRFVYHPTVSSKMPCGWADSFFIFYITILLYVTFLHAA